MQLITLLSKRAHSFCRQKISTCFTLRIDHFHMRAPSAYTFPRSSMLRFSTPMSTGSANTLTITFLASDNKKLECKVKEGQNLLEIAHENDVELEGENALAFLLLLNCVTL